MGNSEILPSEINGAFQYVFYCVHYLQQASEYRKRGDYKNWFDSLMIAGSWISIKMDEKQLKERRYKEDKINDLFIEWAKLNAELGEDKLDSYRPLYLALDELEIWIRRIGDKGGLLMKQGIDLDDDEF
jgi:hypothetical protein